MIGTTLITRTIWYKEVYWDTLPKLENFIKEHANNVLEGEEEDDYELRDHAYLT